MSEQQNSRISIMNFGEQLLGQDEKQFQMNNTWLPITSEKLILVRSNPISDWPVNQIRRTNFQEFQVPGSDYMKEMLLHYNEPDQNLRLMGQTGQTGEHNPFDSNLADRNRVLNHISGSYTQAHHYESSGLNSTLELLLKKNATNVAAANRNLDMSINMAARNPLLPKLHPQASRDVRESYAGIERCNINSASDIMYKDANRFLIPNRNSEFNGSNSDRLLNNDVHCSFSNQLEGIFSEIPHGDSNAKYNLNYVPITEADAMATFTNTLQSIPMTMDPLKFVDNHFCAIPDYTIAESTRENDKQELVSSTEKEIQQYCDGLLQQIVDSSSTAISTSYGDQKGPDSNICGEGSDLGFDLNQTPEQKASKRRKHRPKVIVERKPKRSSNPATQKKQVNENPPKRRKNVMKTAAIPQADVMKETYDSTVATRKSCRKVLNFDLEKSRNECQSRIVCQQEIYHKNDHEKSCGTTSDTKAKEKLSGEKVKHATNLVLLTSQQDELTVENQQSRSMDDITLLLNQNLTNTFSRERKPNMALSVTRDENQIPKFPVTEKGPAQGNSDLCQERRNGCMQQYLHAKEIGNILFQSETCFENSEKTKELICQNTFQSVPKFLSNSIEGKGSKRKHSSINSQHDSSTNPLGTYYCQEILQADENFKGATLAKGFLETPNRKKTKKRLNGRVNRRSSCQIMSKDEPQKVRIKDNNGSQSQPNEEMPNCCIESNEFLEQQNNGDGPGDCFATTGELHHIYSTLIDEIIFRLNSLNLRESNIPEMEAQSALVPYKGDGSVVPYQEFDFAKKHKPRPKVDLDAETERTWKLLMGIEGSISLDGTDKEKEKWWEVERNVFRGRTDSFIARMHLVQGDRRFSKWKGSVVDSVIGVFLTQNVSDHLSSSAFMSLAARFSLKPKSSRRSYAVCTNTLVEEPELCMVNPDDTTISYGRGTFSQLAYHLGFEIPHHATEIWRDSETTRINGSSIKPNSKSLEEEFLSSQNSLDSSITQGTRGNRSCSGSSSESEGPNSGCELSKTQFLTSNSLQVGKTTMFQEFYSSVNGGSLFEERSKDGQVQQAEHAKQSFRVDKNNNHNFHSAFNHPSNFGYPQKQVPAVPSTCYEFHYSDTQGMKTFQMNGEESFWPETVSTHSKLQENYEKFGIQEAGVSADKPTEQYENGTLCCPELPKTNPHGPLSKHLVLLQDTLQSISHTNYNHHSPNHHLLGHKTLQTEGRPYTESSNASHIVGRGQHNTVNDCCNIPQHAEEGFDSEKIISAANTQVCSDNSGAEPEPQKQVYSPGPTNKESKFKVSKARKGKPETEKKHACDWDKLRKDVLADGTRIERSKDTMDSLDYEAVRCASVEEISNTIKERGMNNMLAERIKEFLNRLVKEHGSIDLEWLRHVPPDKVKDYLLSIRGLGLKSVECVRLLTLHHLAFPVDTNVGRIAVRLGWVPLQPLPESLQLHLLELYPVLESIQKYLWPRLCKLDQKTLYELHYQMITFGKVFCTKNKPNCNACPMRAECRHFASAFASARLALPGPEEKRIAGMHVPVATDRNPSLNINPVILPLPENNFIEEASPESGKCEPIIEEPATPEQEWTDALESDIEDFFGEDPDEIPTIELNVREFAVNVQNCMQEYREHNEDDMPKALVALTPQSASIPTPKLKNVSRLRTEHQVYELPDSHPLLEKMEKREPDDPSPYLLAIWTPGETANSIELPERRCGSEGSTNLCNDKTCFSCNGIREANSQTVRGTLLIPCRTATRGSFPLNGTYFQVNETMHLAFNPLISQGNGYGICQGEPYTLGPLYRQFSKASRPKKFSIAFGEGLFVSGGLINKHVHLVLFWPDYIFQQVSQQRQKNENENIRACC